MTETPPAPVHQSPRIGGGLPLLCALLFGFAALHLWLALKFPLAADETYYWEWSRRPAWGYYDQGPMIAWAIRAGCALFGSTQLGVRAPIIFASLLTQLSLWLVFRRFYGARRALFAVAVLEITPLGLVGGFVATYDPLQALFWAAALPLAASAMLDGKRAAWAGLGLMFGLGLLSKHTMALLAVCLLLFLAATPERRRWLRRPEPYFAGLLGLAVFTPNLLWQASHEWITFRHLFLLTGKGTDHGPLQRLGEFVGAQAGLLTPLLFLGFVTALWASWRRDRPESVRFLFWMAAPVLAFFVLLALKSKVQANWAAAGWLAPAGIYAACADRRARGLLSPRAMAASVGICAALSALAVIPELRIVPIPRGWTSQIDKLYGGRELAAAAAPVWREMQAAHGRVAVGAVTYDAASRMAFYLPGQPRAWCPFLRTRLNSYLFWNAEAQPAPGGAALLVDDHAAGDPERPRFEDIFARVEPVHREAPVFNGGLVHTYYLYRCYGYRPNQRAETPRGG